MAVVNFAQPNLIDPELYFRKKPGVFLAAKQLQEQTLPLAQQFAQMSEQKKKQAEWGKAIDDLVAQNPKFLPYSGALKQNPGMFGQIAPELLKSQKQTPEWQPLSGMLSKNGRPMEIDKFSGEIREAGPEGAQSTGYGAMMGPVRKAQYTLQDLPSNQGPSTAGGAAYQVKVAARQGKTIVAKAGSAQRTGLSSGDLARAILRAAPTEEAMKAANFSDNLVTRFSLMKQKLTADPSAVDNPKIRREIYDIFDEMDKSATPFIKNQLDDLESLMGPLPPGIRKRQLGETLPDIPFMEVKESNINPLGGPSIGEVKKGYRFKGGIPSNPSSWEKFQ